MKKRLLITSIVMMLVVAVALSTATYAWFTSNATVTANSITMTATTNAAPTIGISWTNGNYGTEIEPVISNGLNFAPVAPLTLSKTGTITDSDVAFYTALTYSDNGVYLFKEDGRAVSTGDTATYVWTDGDGHTSFFVKNLSTANALNGDLTLTATITGESNNDGAALIRIGVFKYNDSTSKYELIEVLANQDSYTYTGVTAGTITDNTYYKLVNGQYVPAIKATDDNVEGTTGEAAQVAAGTADWYEGMTVTANQFYTRASTATAAKAVYGEIEEDDPVNEMSTYNCATSVNIATDLAAEGVVELKIIVWMDAAALGNNQQSQVAEIELNFDIQ